MTTADLIYDRTKCLPEPMQMAVLRFVDRISSSRGDFATDDEWLVFSEMHLANAYCEADSIYDEEPQ